MLLSTLSSISIEPTWVGVLTPIILAVVGALGFWIRAEVRAGNKQLVNNGGSTMRDAVDRMEARQIEDRGTSKKDHDDLVQEISALRHRMDAHIDNHNRGK